MPDVELTPFLGWIDLSDEDQKRARDYLRSLSEGTVDELGFGIIRDAFADRFFPATSTIMTRARYFTLVPAIYQWVLQRELKGKSAEKECHDLEVNLRNRFRMNGSLRDTRKAEVQRYPASIYWAALRRLRIHQRGGSQSHYFAKVGEYLDLRRNMTDDDKNDHTDEGVLEMWDPRFLQLYAEGALPTPDDHGDFPDDTTLELSRAEAIYLKGKFADDSDDSIISHLVRKDCGESFAYPWRCSYPDSVRREVRHAEHFSMFSKLATLVYYQNLIALQAKLEIDTAPRDLRDTLQLWWNESHVHLAEWDVKDFLELAKEMGSLRGGDAYFIPEFHALAVQAKTAVEFLAQPKVHELTVAREKDKRPTKRRLVAGRFLREWKLPTSANDAYYEDPYHVRYHLDYRAGIASRIVGDIFEGLES